MMKNVFLSIWLQYIWLKGTYGFEVDRTQLRAKLN